MTKKPLFYNWHSVGPFLIWIGRVSPFIRVHRAPSRLRARSQFLSKAMMIVGVGICAGAVAAHDSLGAALGAMILVGGLLRR